jgi:deoxyribodipyrimidine photo-lyase
MSSEREQKPWSLHWFRRDLRIPGNTALRQAWKSTDGRVLGIFCFDSAFLSRPDFSHNRFAFFIKTLRQLKQELQDQGGDLLVVDCQPHLAIPKIFHFLKLKQMPLPNLFTYNRDYEPFARRRDAAIAELVTGFGVEVHTERDHLVIEPEEIKKADGSGGFYQVYSPFSRQWFLKLSTEDVQRRLQSQRQSAQYFERWRNKSLDGIFKMRWEDWLKTSDFPFQDSLEHFENENAKSVTIPIPDAGFGAAFARLDSFRENLQSYKDHRDFPGVPGTSKLSIYFKNGSLTSAQVLSHLDLGHITWADKGGPAHFVKEIAWREFYYSILYHRPEMETQAFLPQYNNLAWSEDTALFERWCQGQTGFPIVDAGMRELNTTGWMHNRVRMIVASFLTKDLLIHWRLGENYFMKQLLDGDLAPNNGGWQWAASTGCDPQPYFRIFNPWLQSQKFDPDGAYIRHHVPELREAPAVAIHDPEADRSRWNYPPPMVDHRAQKEKALALFKGSYVAR